MKAISIIFTLLFVINAQAGSYGGNLNLTSQSASVSYKGLRGERVVLLSGSATLEISKKFGLGRRLVTIIDSEGRSLTLTVKGSYFKKDLDLNVKEKNLEVKTTVVSKALNEKYERPGTITLSRDCSYFTVDGDGNSQYVSDTCYDSYPSIDLAQDYDTQYRVNFIINGQPLEFVHSQTTTKIFSQRRIR